MGLPFSLVANAIMFAMPDATPQEISGLQVLKGTWKWGSKPWGEPAIAVPKGGYYMVMTPDQFEEYASSHNSTTTTTATAMSTSTVIETPHSTPDAEAMWEEYGDNVGYVEYMRDLKRRRLYNEVEDS